MWSRDQKEHLPGHWHELLTEIDARGYVSREIAVTRSGALVYRAPSRRNERLLFDGQVVEAGESDDTALEERFRRLWGQCSRKGKRWAPDHDVEARWLGARSGNALPSRAV